MEKAMRGKVEENYRAQKTEDRRSRGVKKEKGKNKRKK